jgi:hypothetical protein
VWRSSISTCRTVSASDRSCEAIVHGDKTLLKQFVVAGNRGPTGAVIERVETSTLPVDPPNRPV